MTNCCILELGYDDSYIVCVRCKKNYHYACLPLDEMLLNTETRTAWSYSECIQNIPKTTRKDNTPIRNVTSVRGSNRQALTSPPIQGNQTYSR